MGDRSKDLAVIHVAKKQLGLADADYRMLLNERYGVLSAAALKDPERQDLIAEFERRGFKNLRNVRARAKDTDMLARIRWRLGQAGRPVEYGDALAKRLCNVDRLDWCTPDMQRKVLAALETDRRRRAWRASELPAVLRDIALAFSSLEKRISAMYAGALGRKGASPASATAWVLATLDEEAAGVIELLGSAPPVDYRSDGQYARDRRAAERRERSLANARALRAQIKEARRVAG